MKTTYFNVLLHFALPVALISFACGGPISSVMKKNENSLLCDVETGMCELPMKSQALQGQPVFGATPKPVKLIYFTDPICSSCWGIEPQLRRLKLEYGATVEIEYHMGGLLPDWSYNSGGISKPSDVARHWDEVSPHYDMPIDGDVWLEDPLQSSYPPSIAFKAAQIQDEAKAIRFLRILREMVFLQKKNITRWEWVEIAAVQAGLDPAKLRTDCEGAGKTAFEADLALARKMGVRGFPTIFVTNAEGRQELLYGARPYTNFENAVLQCHPPAQRQPYGKTWEKLFAIYPTLTAREFSELSEIPRKEAEPFLQDLVAKGHLKVWKTKNGHIWELAEKSKY
jgi:putative protein-disulfide isomerase